MFAVPDVDKYNEEILIFDVEVVNYIPCCKALIFKCV